MNIGIISVREDDYPPNLRLRQAAEKQGHRVSLLHPYRLWPALMGSAPIVTGDLESLPDVVLPRQGATLGDTCLSLIRQFELMGIPVINGMEAIRKAKDKFLTLQSLWEKGLSVPDTILVNQDVGLHRAVSILGGYPVVIKSVSGRQGTDVKLVKTDSDLEAASQDLNRRTGLLMQRFIPPESRSDIRIVTIGERVAGAAAFSPPVGDFRANFHLSGKSRAIHPEGKILDLALKAAAALGLEIAGIDILVDAGKTPFIVEVNYSPGFRGLEKATGLDIAGKIVRYLWHRFQKASPPHEDPTGFRSP